MIKTIYFLSVVLFIGCVEHYPCYTTDVTFYDIDGNERKTALDITVIRDDAPITLEFLYEIDKRTTDLEKCLVEKNRLGGIKYVWIGVYVPNDWYISSCSGEQLIPSSVNPQLCINKGLDLPEECYWVEVPTERCPCVCNVRAVIQDCFWIVVTPNLKLYKAELARMVLGINNPWADEEVASCLGE